MSQENSQTMIMQNLGGGGGVKEVYYGIVQVVNRPLSKFCINIVSIFSWDLQWSQEKIKTMLMQNFGVQKNNIMVLLKVAYSDRPNWTPTSPITITKRIVYLNALEITCKGKQARCH